MRVLASRFFVLVAVCALAACAGSGGGNGGGGGSGPSCKAPAQPTISFTGNIQPIFDRSCALAGCHVPGSLGGNLDLTAGSSYRQIVNRPAFEQARKVRVKPGESDASYLVQKIEGTPGISGQIMPLPSSGLTLPPDDLAAIRTWITECATQN